MSYKIFVINPGSTSTKLAYFEDEKKLFETNVFHDAPFLASLGNVNNQLGYRLELIRNFLDENGIDLTGIEYTDIFEAAQGAYNLLGSGASIDEIRVLTGRPELGTKWSRKHLISKNFADLETIEDLGKIGNGGTDPPAGNPEPGGDPPADGEKGATENGGKEEENA